MDPITAVCRLLEAITNLVTAIISGQTPEQKKIFWDRWIEITQPLHELLKKLTPQ